MYYQPSLGADISPYVNKAVVARRGYQGFGGSVVYPACGVGAAGDQYVETTWGHVALASAGALLLGVGLGVTYGRRSRTS